MSDTPTELDPLGDFVHEEDTDSTTPETPIEASPLPPDLTLTKYIEQYMNDYTPEKLNQVFYRDLGWVVAATLADLFKRLPRLTAYISAADEALTDPKSIPHEMLLQNKRGDLIGPSVVGGKRAIAEDALMTILDFARKFAATNLEILKANQNTGSDEAAQIQKAISNMSKEELQSLLSFLDGLKSHGK